MLDGNYLPQFTFYPDFGGYLTKHMSKASYFSYLESTNVKRKKKILSLKLVVWCIQIQADFSLIRVTKSEVQDLF